MPSESEKKLAAGERQTKIFSCCVDVIQYCDVVQGVDSLCACAFCPKRYVHKADGTWIEKR